MKNLSNIARIVLIGLAGSSMVSPIASAAPRAAAPPSASVEKPEAFVRRVYALYRKGGDGVSTERPGGAPFYTAALLDAFAKDSALARGEVGAIDGDPICDCQDHGTIRVDSVALTKGEADTVKARVAITNFGSHQIIILTLARTSAGWRIADVGSKDMKSVMAVLQDAIAHPIQDAPPSQNAPPSKAAPAPQKP